MGSEMVLALSSATVDRHTLFGHNASRPLGEHQPPRRTAAMRQQERTSQMTEL